MPIEAQPIGPPASVACEQVNQRVCSNRLARAAFAHQAQCFASANLQSDPVNGLYRAARYREFNVQVADVQQYVLVLHHLRVLTSSMSRTPSPSRLKLRTVKVRATPGNSTIHHFPASRLAAPSATMMPHSAVGCCMPRPMKERLAALRIAQPRAVDTCTLRVGNVFGTMKVSMMRNSLLPPARAAST